MVWGYQGQLVEFKPKQPSLEECKYLCGRTQLVTCKSKTRKNVHGNQQFCSTSTKSTTFQLNQGHSSVGGSSQENGSRLFIRAQVVLSVYVKYTLYQVKGCKDGMLWWKRFPLTNPGPDAKGRLSLFLLVIHIYPRVFLPSRNTLLQTPIRFSISVNWLTCNCRITVSILRMHRRCWSPATFKVTKKLHFVYQHNGYL